MTIPPNISHLILAITVFVITINFAICIKKLINTISSLQEEINRIVEFITHKEN